MWFFYIKVDVFPKFNFYDWVCIADESMHIIQNQKIEKPKKKEKKLCLSNTVLCQVCLQKSSLRNTRNYITYIWSFVSKITSNANIPFDLKL